MSESTLPEQEVLILDQEAAVETPKTETPKTEAPKAPAPKAEVPKDPYEGTAAEGLTPISGYQALGVVAAVFALVFIIAAVVVGTPFIKDGIAAVKANPVSAQDLSGVITLPRKKAVVAPVTAAVVSPVAPVAAKQQVPESWSPALISLIKNNQVYREFEEDERWDHLEVTKKKAYVEDNTLVTRVFIEDIRDEVEYEILHAVRDVYSVTSDQVSFIVRDDQLLAIRQGTSGAWIAKEGTVYVYDDGTFETIPVSREREGYVKAWAEVGDDHPLDMIFD